VAAPAASRRAYLWSSQNPRAWGDTGGIRRRGRAHHDGEERSTICATDITPPVEPNFPDCHHQGHFPHLARLLRARAPGAAHQNADKKTSSKGQVPSKHFDLTRGNGPRPRTFALDGGRARSHPPSTEPSGTASATRSEPDLQVRGHARYIYLCLRRGPAVLCDSGTVSFGPGWGLAVRRPGAAGRARGRLRRSSGLPPDEADVVEGLVAVILGEVATEGRRRCLALRRGLRIRPSPLGFRPGRRGLVPGALGGVVIDGLRWCRAVWGGVRTRPGPRHLHPGRGGLASVVAGHIEHGVGRLTVVWLRPRARTGNDGKQEGQAGGGAVSDAERSDEARRRQRAGRDPFRPYMGRDDTLAALLDARELERASHRPGPKWATSGVRPCADHAR